jgi:hypothetical protein
MPDVVESKESVQLDWAKHEVRNEIDVTLLAVQGRHVDRGPGT